MSCANAPTAMKRTTIIATKEKLDLAISELCVVMCLSEREVEGVREMRVREVLVFAAQMGKEYGYIGKTSWISEI